MEKYLKIVNFVLTAYLIFVKSHCIAQSPSVVSDSSSDLD